MDRTVVVEMATDRWMVRVVGDLDMATAPELIEAVSQLDLSSGRTIEVDLARCDFLDSAGLTALARCAVVAARTSKPLVVSGINDRARRLFEITGFSGTDSPFDLVC